MPRYDVRIRDKDEEGNPVSEWDGATFFGGTDLLNDQYGISQIPSGGPSKSPDRMVSVYGDGSYYCVKLTRDQLVELVWRWKSLKFAVDTTAQTLWQYSASAASSGSPPEYGITFDYSTSKSDSMQGPDPLTIKYGDDPENPNHIGLDLVNYARNRTEPKLTVYPGTFSLQKDLDGSVISPQPFPKWSTSIPHSQTGDGPYGGDGVMHYPVEILVGDWYLLPEFGSGASAEMQASINSYQWLDFIKVSENEFWWNPPINILSGLSGGPVIAKSMTGVAAVYLRAAAGTLHFKDTGLFDGNTAQLGVIRSSVPVDVVFSGDRIATGNKYFNTAWWWNMMGFDPVPDPSVTTFSKTEGGAFVSMSFDPAALRPDGITISAHKYFTYGSRWNEDTGLLV